jgi:branched-chain amino acid transport system substrate-binding protein
MRRLWYIVSLATVILASCSRTNTGEAGVTPDTIRVGMICDLTGPAAFLGQELSAGARLYLQHVNQQGGVHGRKIELIVEDDGYQPPRTVAACRKLLDRDRVLCFFANLGTATTLAIERILEKERVPLVAASAYSSVLSDPPRRYIFPVEPSYRTQSWIMVNHIREHGANGKPRIGVVYQDDDFGGDGLKGVREAAAYYKFDIVGAESHKRGATDFSTQVLNLKRANATHVILWTLIREAAAILKNAQQLNWNPRFLGNNTFADDKIVELAGEAAANLAVIDMGYLAESKGMTSYRELNRKYTPDHAPRTLHAGGFVFAQLLVEALKRAGKELDREKLVQALESFREWDDNILGAPFTYGPGQRSGSVARVLFARADVAHKRLVADSEPVRFRKPADWAKAGPKD